MPDEMPTGPEPGPKRSRGFGWAVLGAAESLVRIVLILTAVIVAGVIGLFLYCAFGTNNG